MILQTISFWKITATFCCLSNIPKRMLYYTNTSVIPFFLNICRVDNYGIKNKLAFEVAYAGYRNQQDGLRFVQLQPPVVAVKQE